jgi:hypothetical protein
MSEVRVPEELLHRVAGDLRPVRPLAPPERRILSVAPIGLLLLVAVPAYWGWRQNLPALGPVLGWGLSVLQALAGLAVVTLGLRESVPGRDLARATLAAVLAASGALVVGVTLLTDALLPTAVPAGAGWRYAWECLFMAGAPGAAGVFAATWLVARGLPLRPSVAGALCGLGTGLIADGGARLFCWVSTPAHVLAAHGGAIVALALLGAATSSVIDRARDARSPS